MDITIKTVLELLALVFVVISMFSYMMSLRTSSLVSGLTIGIVLIFISGTPIGKQSLFENFKTLDNKVVSNKPIEPKIQNKQEQNNINSIIDEIKKVALAAFLLTLFSMVFVWLLSKTKEENETNNNERSSIQLTQTRNLGSENQTENFRRINNTDSLEKSIRKNMQSLNKNSNNQEFELKQKEQGSTNHNDNINIKLEKNTNRRKLSI